MSASGPSSDIASLLFGFRLEPAKPVVPERLEPGPEVRHASRSGAIPAPDPVATLVDETGFPKHGEVLRDGRASDIEPGRDRAGRHLSIANEQQDRAPIRFGDGSE